LSHLPSLGQLHDLCCHTIKSHPSHSLNPFLHSWHSIALQNTQVFDHLEWSLYRSPDLVTFKSLLLGYEYPSYSASAAPGEGRGSVRELLETVRGSLVLWPAEFLLNEFLF
jgi:hypothetical protein